MKLGKTITLTKEEFFDILAEGVLVRYNIDNVTRLGAYVDSNTGDLVYVVLEYDELSQGG